MGVRYEYKELISIPKCLECNAFMESIEGDYIWRCPDCGYTFAELPLDLFTDEVDIDGKTKM